MSDSKAGLYAALAKAQAEYGAVERSAMNPHFKKPYAPLDKVLEAVGPALAANGLCHYWRNGMAKDGEFVVVTVTAIIGHAESGETIESALSWGVPDDIQKLGAALTYMRRYTLEAIAGVAADSDDDGNGTAAERTPARAPAHKPVADAKTKAALDKGATNRNDEETAEFEAAVAALGWTLPAFKDDLLGFARIKVPTLIDVPFAKWQDWIKAKARELYKSIKDEQAGAAPTEESYKGVEADSVPY